MTHPPLPGASLTVAPADWQILQQSSGAARLDLAGVYRCDAPRLRVEARLVREESGAPVTAALDWRAAELEDGQRWRITLDRIPAGGLYRVECRVWRDGCPDIRPTRGDYVHHLGVGDVWVIAGQSNASGTGLGPVDDPPTLGVHLFGNDERWQLACHPLEDATRTLHPLTVHGVFQAHSPWLAFGRRLLRELRRPIGLIPAALGGASMLQWDPDKVDGLFANLLDLVGKAGGRVRGVLWYQGESDAQGQQSGVYLDRFTALVEALRAKLGDPELPILTAQLGRTSGDPSNVRDHHWSVVREAQRQAASRLHNVALVPAVDLPMSDEIHVSAVGNVLLGERFAATALRLLEGRDLPDPALRLVSAERSPGEQVVKLRFVRPPAGWCRPGAIRDFRVEDETGEVEVRAVRLADDGTVELVLARASANGLAVHCHYGCNPTADLRDRDQRPVEAFSVRVG